MTFSEEQESLWDELSFFLPRFPQVIVIVVCQLLMNMGIQVLTSPYKQDHFVCATSQKKHLFYHFDPCFSCRLKGRRYCLMWGCFPKVIARVGEIGAMWRSKYAHFCSSNTRDIILVLTRFMKKCGKKWGKSQRTFVNLKCFCMSPTQGFLQSS